MGGRQRALVIGLVALSLLVAGCGSGGSEGGGVTRPSTTVSRPVRSTTTDVSTTTPPPTTAAPDVSGVPTTRAPIIGAPATSAPITTAPPTTAAPTTALPTTAPPTTTTTIPPTTTTTSEATTTSAATTSSEVTPTTTPAGSEVEDEASSSTWWPWILLALLLIGLIWLLLARRARRAAMARARTERALSEATELAAHLAALAPEGVQVVAAQDAARLAALGAELDLLAADEADLERKATLARVGAQALALHGVVDSVSLSPGQPTDAAIRNLVEQATVLHTVSEQAIAELFPPPPSAV